LSANFHPEQHEPGFTVGTRHAAALADARELLHIPLVKSLQRMVRPSRHTRIDSS